MNIDGRTALVTGGTAGIGKAIVDRLVREGSDVVVADRDRPADDSARFLEVDVTDRGQVQEMVADTEPSILVNNAGGYSAPVFPDAPLDHWEYALDLNLRAVMLAIHFATPLMARLGEGAIVNIGSSAGLGFDAYPGPEYAAAKAAVMRLTSSLAWLSGRGVRVNCVCPHTVATTAVLDRISELQAQGEALPPDLAVELIDPEEVADAVVALIADDALAGRIVVLVGGEEWQWLPA
jgi:NAD(P)-dependent dehydrogenase (short-subunit alcohol dehydrogenase family)